MAGTRPALKRLSDRQTRPPAAARLIEECAFMEVFRRTLLRAASAATPAGRAGQVGELEIYAS